MASQVPPRPMMGQKPPKEGSDPVRLAAVARMPCVICTLYNMRQTSPTKVHHCIHGRYSRKRAPDKKTIPLCDGHHQGDFDTSKIALHREPDRWKDAYGLDTDYLNWTEERLRNMP